MRLPGLQGVSMKRDAVATSRYREATDNASFGFARAGIETASFYCGARK
jgi:hypothetical protein